MDDLPFLDLNDPTFSTRGPAVLAARDQSWCARTPFGLAVLRHRQAGHILRDRRFRQGSHDWPRKVDLKGTFAEFWQRSIISLEDEIHKTQRRAAQAALSEDFVLGLCPDFEGFAAGLLDALPTTFEFVTGFSEPFAGLAVARILGLPADRAETLAKDASTLGLAMGIGAKSYEAEVNAATDRLMDLSDTLMANAPKDSFVPRLQRAALDLGIDDPQVLRDLIVISIFGGVDTTRAQLAFAVELFITAPDHWDRLRREPDAVPDAIAEVIRLRPTTTWASRETVADVSMDGVDIPAGTAVQIFVHASSTDPNNGHDGGFDPFARRKMHFGFGGGAHHCLGQFVARTDMACALRMMLARVNRFHWDGTPEFLPDSGNTSPLSLPVRMERSV